jgi:hypothetical protein
LVQPIGHILKGRETLGDLTLEHGTDRLSRNVGTELPLYDA